MKSKLAGVGAVGAEICFKSCLVTAALSVGVLGATAASATTIDFTTLQLNGSILQRSDQTSSLALQVFELLMLTVWLFVVLVAIKLNKWFE